MSASPASAAASSPDRDRQSVASWARQQRRLRHRLHLLGMVLAGYTLDSLLLFALASLGVVQPDAAWAYAGIGLAVCAVFFNLLRSPSSDRRNEPYLVVPQMLASVAVTAIFIAWVPQIGGLLLMTLIVMFAFAAQRMGLRPALLGALATSVLVGVVVALVGERIALPIASGPERFVSVLWLTLVLVRSALLGGYAENLRALLAKRKALIADNVDQLQQLASRDELTGALNRRSVLRLLDEERERMQRTGQPFGVALLDIDHFGQINEVHGQQVGDDVLRRFSLKVAAELRNTDRLGRYGGEEFLMLLTAVTDLGAAEEVACRVCEAVAAHAWGELLARQGITVSAGVTMCRPGDSIEQLLARADLARCKAKHDGRNCVRTA